MVNGKEGGGSYEYWENSLDLPKFYFRPYEYISSRGELH